MYNIHQIQEKINEKFQNERLQVLSFTKIKEPTSIQCLDCKTIYNFSTMNNVIHSNKKNICDNCNPVLRKDTMEIKHKIDYLIKTLTDIEVVGEFINITTDMKFLCKKCNVNFNRKPQVFLKTQKCPYCDSRAKSKPHSLFLKDLSEKYGNEYTCLEEYKNASTKIKIKHNCGFIWEISPHNLLCGKGCPKCNRFSSKGETKIAKFLEKNGILYLREYRFLELNNLRFDFYLPEQKMVIEFQGEQHYKPIDYFGGVAHFIIQQQHDECKRDFCKNHNINLLEIRFDEINNIEQILTNKLNDYPAREYIQANGKESQPKG